MNIRGKSQLPKFSGVLLLGIVVLCASPCLADHEKQWPVKYLAGSKKANVGARLELFITSASVTFKKGKETVMDIPAADITEVGYDTSSHNRGWTWLKAGTELTGHGTCSSGGGLANCGELETLVLAPVVVGAAALSPFSSTQHFVRLLWQENGVPTQALFEVGKENYSAVLNELQHATGKPWQDLPEARKKLVSEIETAKDGSVPLQIDRTVVVGETVMKAGRYQTVLLERPDHDGEIYFFDGNRVDPRHVTAQAVINVEASSAETTVSGVTYVVEQGVETIGAIQLADKKLVFVSTALPPRVAKSARSFFGGGNEWATVIQTNYQGEPALRFHVVHLSFPHVCQEYVFVTRAHVVSEIAPNSPQSGCRTFSASRTEVKAVAQGAKWTNFFLKVTVADQSYGLQPVFEGGNGEFKISGLGKSRDAAREYSAFFVQTIADFDSAFANPQP